MTEIPGNEEPLRKMHPVSPCASAQYRASRAGRTIPIPPPVTDHCQSHDLRGPARADHVFTDTYAVRIRPVWYRTWLTVLRSSVICYLRAVFGARDDVGLS